MNQNIISMVRSAERILIPVSTDATSGIGMFTEQTGIEVPNTLREDELVYSAGRTFRLVRGADMPGQIAAGWGDIALCSTEFVREANEPAVQSASFGDPLCRYSVLALNEKMREWQELLTRGSRYPQQTRMLPATFRRFLNIIAASRDLPVMAMNVPISGKAEATMRESGVGAVADRVVTGRTVQKQGGQEVYVLANIYPEFVWRRQNADIR